MPTISLLSIGCIGQELVDKINEIIAVVNGGLGTVSYNDLTNKPSINGVTLMYDKTTENLRIATADTTDYDTLMATLGTKAEITAAQTAATSAATAAVQSQIANKLDKNPTSVTEVKQLSDDTFLYVYGDGSSRKISLKNLTKNIELQMLDEESISKAVNEGLTMMALQGNKDGTNKDFTTTSAFVLKTTNLFLNGQRLTLGEDYTEETNTKITLTEAPVSTDTLVLIAVPR